MKRLAALFLLIAYILTGCSTTGTIRTDKGVMQTADATAATTATPSTTPKNLFGEAFDTSHPIEELGVGELAYSSFEALEAPNGHMVPVTRDKFGNPCITRGARTWGQSAARVGEFAYVNIAIRRTGNKHYQVIADPEMEDVIKLTLSDERTTLRCIDGTSVEVLSDRHSRAVLHLFSDMTNGGKGYVPATLVWVAGPASRTGRLLANVTSIEPFAGSVLVAVRSGSAHVDSTKSLRGVGESQMAVENKTKTFPLIIIDN